MIIKITYLVINIFFLLIFIVNFTIGLIRDIKAKKVLKANPQTLKAYVRQVDKVKNRIYMLVDFQSPHNRLNFSETYEFFDSDLKGKEYNVGDEIDLIYNDVSSWKKVNAFPLLFKDFKVKLEKGPFMLNLILVLFGAYMVYITLRRYITNNAFNTDIPLTGEKGIYENPLYIFVMIFVYAMILTYVITNILEMPKKELQNYLKLNGNVTKARVKTYKFGRQKNSKGNKESIITIEFSTSDGTQVETKLTSFLYTETQQEYIDIIYDPKQPKRVVFLRP